MPLLALAAFVPCVLAFEYGPVVGQLQEQVSYALWALCMALLAWQPQRTLCLERPALLLLGLMLLLGVWALVQCSVVLRVPHRGLLSFFYLSAAAALLCSGAISAQASGPSAVRWVLGGLLAAGLLNAAIAMVQVVSPVTADDVWIAQGFAAGRANGNLRQPNQLAALMVMALLALWALMPAGRRGTALSIMLTVPLLLGTVLSASRFGLLCALLVIVHGIFFPWAPELRRRASAALLALLLLWLGTWLMAKSGGVELAINERLAHESASGSRWPLWHASLSLLRAHPWWGVGWGEFNRAWMLTPKSVPTTHSFSNAHNLPLHWAVELGVPMALVACAVVMGCVRRLWQSSKLRPREAPLAKAVALIATVLLLYSLIEFPLWFSRFLFPLCFLVGWAAHAPSAGVAIRLPAWKALTGVLLLAVLLAHLDYRATAGLRDIRGLSAQQTEDGVARGRSSFLYSATAFRATALAMRHDPLAVGAIAYAAQDYLDVPLMGVWAEALDADAAHPRAQYLLDRMSEMGAPTRRGGCDSLPAEADDCRAKAAALRPADFR